MTKLRLALTRRRNQNRIARSVRAAASAELRADMLRAGIRPYPHY